MTLFKVGNNCGDAVEIMIQHLAVKVPEKAEFRHKASAAIVALILGLDQDAFTRTVHWFFKFGHNEKSSHRLFAIEVMGKLLNENERENKAQNSDEEASDDARPQLSQIQEQSAEEKDSSDEEKEEEPVVSPRKDTGNLISHKFLFGVVFSRCRDISATVRAKALQTLAEITAANNRTMAKVIQNIFEDIEAVGPSSNEPIDFVELLQDPNVDLSTINPLPTTDAFIEFLRRRALDDSVYVRKNALQVLENILKFSAGTSDNSGLLKSQYGQELVKILSETL